MKRIAVAALIVRAIISIDTSALAQEPLPTQDPSRAAITQTVFLPVTIKPLPQLYVGLEVRWDGAGYVRGSWYADMGVTTRAYFDSMTDADTIRGIWQQFYDPNPYALPVENWLAYYSVSSLTYKSGSGVPDPAWKWGHPWILPAGLNLENGDVVLVDDREFDVAGPYAGYTAFGKPMKYWQFTNRTKFLFWNGGGEWTQYVHPGDVVLRFDAGHTRLEVYSNILRRYYYNGQLNGNTVQYIKQLTQAGSWPTTQFSGVQWIENVQQSTSSDESQFADPSGRSKPFPATVNVK